MNDVDRRELDELTVSELALLLVELEEERELQELGMAVLGCDSELVSEEVRNDQM